MNDPLTVEQATGLVEQVSKLVFEDRLGAPRHAHHARKRLASDLEGLQEVERLVEQGWIAQSPSVVLWLRHTFSEGLRRTAREWGARAE